LHGIGDAALPKRNEGAESRVVLVRAGNNRVIAPPIVPQKPNFRAEQPPRQPVTQFNLNVTLSPEATGINQPIYEHEQCVPTAVISPRWISRAALREPPWTQDLSGVWSDANNWLNGVVAPRTGSAAFFNAK
jgi:hypothetical protein